MVCERLDGVLSGEVITSLLQQAIDTVTQAGGGRVVIPAGTWPCGSVRLRDGVELHLEHGAHVRALSDPEAFPPIPGANRPALLWADGARDIAITGTGTIDGDGHSVRWEPEIDQTEFRHSLVIFHDCLGVRIHDINLWWSRMWTLHLQRCEDVSIRGIDLRSHRRRINADGIDPDDCRRVRISDCFISTGDDAIVVKSTGGGICEDIVVTGCILESSCAAVKIGTESLGTIRNVQVSNCIVRDSNVGLSLYLKDGGTYEAIRYVNCQVEAVNDVPVLIDHTPRFFDETSPGVLRDVAILDCSVRAAGRLVIAGVAAAPVTGVRIRDLDWYLTGPLTSGPDVDKPAGAARVRLDPSREPIGTTPHHLVLEHVADAMIDGLRFHHAADNLGQRGLLRARGTKRVFIRARGLTEHCDGDGILIEDGAECDVSHD